MTLINDAVTTDLEGSNKEKESIPYIATNKKDLKDLKEFGYTENIKVIDGKIFIKLEDD